MSIFKPKPKLPAPPAYNKITCMNLRCMREITHDQLLFRLSPPQEVDDYRVRTFTGARQSAAAGRKPSAPKSIFDDDEDEDGGGEETPAAPVPVDEKSSRLDEMVKYYYANPQGSHSGIGYVYDGGERPNMIYISAARIGEAAGGAFPRPAFRKYFKNNPATNYVIGIVDAYGNETTTAVCPHCHMPVFVKSGLCETIVIPIVGVSQSGKTVLISRSFAPFLKNTVMPMMDGVVLPTDSDTKKYIREFDDSLEESGSIAATLGVQKLSYQLENRDRKIAIYTFDLPGEHIANEKYKEFREKELSRLLQRADGLVVIFCPEQIADITKSSLRADSDSEGGAAMKELEDMIRLLAEEADSAEYVKTKNIPIAVIMTKLDLLRDGGINRKVDCSRMGAGAKRLLGPILDRPEISSFGGEKNVVSIGEIELASNKTRDFFNEIVPNEIGLITLKFASNKHNVGYFATSAQGSEVDAEVDYPPIRPSEPFYWLFAKMGIYKQPEAPSGGTKRRF